MLATFQAGLQKAGRDLAYLLVHLLPCPALPDTEILLTDRSGARTRARVIREQTRKGISAGRRIHGLSPDCAIRIASLGELAYCTDRARWSRTIPNGRSAPPGELSFQRQSAREWQTMSELDPQPLALVDMLGASAWWPGLEPGQRRRVGAEVEERRFQGGTVVMRRGEVVEAWTGVIEGLVKMSSVSAAGKSVTFTGIGAGGWFGEGSLLKNEARKYDIVALRDTRMAWMPRSTFDWLLSTSIPFNRFLLLQLNERLGQFIGLVEYERMLEPDARVARCLAEMFNPHLYPGHRSELEISQEEIGYLSGVSRQRVNQALQVLARAKLVEVEYGSVRIVDLAALRRYGG